MARKKATTKPGDKRTIVSDERRERLKAQSPWQKGKSGNPKGRPAIPQEVKDALATHSLEAVLVRVDLMRNSTNEMVKLKATDGFIDPFVGKAVQRQEIDVKVTHIADFIASITSDLDDDVIEAEEVEALPAPEDEDA